MSGRSVQITQTQKQLTIGETSALCAVSVRMLRHWESMGLLHPSRDSKGYRLYSEDDIARIRRIRLYRDLGLTTDQIRAAIDGPATETLSLMREQRTRISEHITQLQLILQDIDELSAYAHNMKEDETMDNPYANDAHDRWGDSPQWMEYAEYRTRTDDAQQQADLDAMRALELELAQAMRDGVKPGSEAADELALRHRESLTWYHVTPSMHVCLAKMYVNDPRFRAHYDSIEPGLAVWLHDAIAAQAATEGVDAAHARWE
ncbi:MerR family transcriptional regulator [Bifidobacterium pseudolongum]|uniref:Transcriptional regulator n=1 Tax=Bifidobacterium pseudolongum subsp. globosum TaxID=1690 RepID=A0A2N3R627_9BIFI|nr:MerR family transcriptional regulator [Bifidobacterium pseudolongum]PKV04813.1 transcriptional regulator [Bifidobacterium pseudolongum subsp. globosum]